MNRIRPGDILILVLALAIIVMSLGFYRNVSGKPTVYVQAENRQWVYDLSVDTTVVFTGPIGKTGMEIHDSRVHVHDSDCRDKICVSAGWISKPGEWIACLPNDVFIYIEGTKEEGGLDDVSF